MKQRQLQVAILVDVQSDSDDNLSAAIADALLLLQAERSMRNGTGPATACYIYGDVLCTVEWKQTWRKIDGAGLDKTAGGFRAIPRILEAAEK